MLQLCFYGLFVQNFAIALVSLVFYLCIQRQEDVIDGITDCFNQFAFDQITTRLFKRKNKFNKILKKKDCFKHPIENGLKSKVRSLIIKTNSYLFYN